ncbi:hypothetical protein L249_7623 [Ophiocordyceps polyrhachis-furcata BCC 54312]|uniref:Uncharacterized protein n=1 Tax=Ophiocordyceps polyrhachis-furcata BCC 54312 TaxID=1330021 RepID=A0A367LB49_9HYPO|nr:hypothetical protein L249_7623 [Ophiocordyceps polyrhachis-furcata BCC 54312]
MRCHCVVHANLHPPRRQPVVHKRRHVTLPDVASSFVPSPLNLFEHHDNCSLSYSASKQQTPPKSPSPPRQTRRANTTQQLVQDTSLETNIAQDS